MKKKFLLFSVSLLLVSCGNQVDTTSEDNSTSSQEAITISLKEMMNKYKQMGNYTYIVKDEVLNVETTLRYTKKAYYYSPSQKEHGGDAIGYAENDNGVFSYVINDDSSVTMGQYITDSKGNYVHNMWLYTILSFLDIEINSLPDTGNDNVYQITDYNNKLLISGLCGYGDTVVQSYIDVYIELLSNDSFRTIVHTSGLTANYQGYIYGYITDVGSTTIPEIETVLENNGGPEILDEALIDMLKKLNTSKNYTIELSGKKNYLDRFTVRNYYSQNIDDDSLSKGYASFENGVFKYTIIDNEINPGELISNGSGGYFDSIWNGLPNFNSFASLNLARINYTKKDNKYIITDTSVVYTFGIISHVDENLAMNENNSLEITLSNEMMNYTLNIEGLGQIFGIVKNIDTTSIKEIEDYVASGGGPKTFDDLDSKARGVISSLVKARNYSVVIESTFTNNSFTMNKKFTSKAYYQEKGNDNFGYIEKDEGIFSFNKQNEVLLLGNKVKDEGTFLWASDLFKGFNRIDSSSLSGKKISDNKYTITDNTNKNYLYEIANFTQYDLMFYVKSVEFEIKNEEKLEVIFTINLGDYGKVNLSVFDVNTTVIENIDTL